MRMETPSIFHRLFRKNPFVGFAVVGLVSTILDIGALNLSHAAGLPVFWATALGFLVGTTNGYLMNSALVFDQKQTAKGYGKFAVIALGGLVFTELIVFIGHTRLGHSLNASKLVAVFLVFFWNYGLNRAWTFADTG